MTTALRYWVTEWVSTSVRVTPTSTTWQWVPQTSRRPILHRSPEQGAAAATTTKSPLHGNAIVNNHAIQWQRTEHWGRGGMRAAAAPARISLPAFEALVLSPTTNYHLFCIERFAAADHHPLILSDTRYLVYQLRTKYCFLNRFAAKRTAEQSHIIVLTLNVFCGLDLKELLSPFACKPSGITLLINTWIAGIKFLHFDLGIWSPNRLRSTPFCWTFSLSPFIISAGNDWTLGIQPFYFPYQWAR